MTISTGTILKAVATMLWDDGEVNQNVFNYTITGGGGPWDEADVLDDALDWLADVYGHLAAVIVETLNGSHITVYKWDSGDGDWDEVGQTNWTWIPDGTADPLPRGVAALINFKTNDPDVNGKKYIPGTSEDRLTDSLWSGTMVTALAAFAAEMVEPFTGFSTSATNTPTVWSVKHEVAIPLSGSYVIPIIPAYQRRRKNNVGI